MVTEMKISRATKVRKYFLDKMSFTTGPVELEWWMEQGQPVNTVDVRAAEDYAEGRIPATSNLSKTNEWGRQATQNHLAQGQDQRRLSLFTGVPPCCNGGS